MTFFNKIKVFLFFLIFINGPGQLAAQKKELVLAIHPYLSFDELKKRYKPIAEYLQKETGYQIKIKIGTNYKEHITNIGEDRLDIAFLGPASYVKLTKTFGGKPLLARLEIKGKPYFQGKIIVHVNSNIKHLKELRKKIFAFGDPSSTMSHLVPRYMLLKNGIKVSDLADHGFLGSHNNVALSVLSGDYDAGAVKEEVFYKFKNRGLRELASTPRISEHVFVTRSNMPVNLINKIRKAMLKLHENPGGKKIMENIKRDMTALVPVKDSDYNNLRRILFKLQKTGIKW